VVAIYSTFLQRALDQVMMDVCLHKLPVTFVLDRAGITGDDGASHHGALDLAYLRCIPGMTVSAPSTPDEMRRLLATGLQSPGPFALRFPRGAAPASATAPLEPVPVGRGVVLREGRDVALLAIGKMVDVALAAAERLATAGITATVVDARFAKPIDPDLAAVAERHRAALTVEDGTVRGGFGSGVLEALSAAGVGVPTRVLGLPDSFIEHGHQGRLLSGFGLDADGVVEAARELLRRGTESALAG
jgi:1-deoxy-D-xylulose-5-phosphate synthase